ncbi:head maturation protease, ClpP-related [Mycobacteroides abscessus]|uniref:ATP-dependent Clp protease proteolytic subunit n=1 Tax=Mycobacteroides abscessus subsp. massiliense TaxID=1962118 RepID=A0A1U0WS60_9MYCO|nr:head maturation protease, ClpP-related [Mycobacteroides abscessus]QSM01947.1 capsid maturation protease [Mycobacterium phage prophiGD11-3]QSM04571.1 capsid maturation protease [Mycobacterium phage prophiGD08-3]MBE5409547.1 ATP-dependent Clp endopeptidase, proteolytic subunit ClpP [Mycobacteroides abscessus]MBN7350714.1 ATP-dependent Clp protease proteolytic subunit [Mycobacteroides abscessus subsp. abscessus]MBN7520685.1 ATP-dependent Clp protease proteolytic subunit [Mycobacteroides absces
MVNKPELPNRARPANSTPARPWYRIQNKADDGTAQIDIYDEIHWFWGINAADFRRDLLALGDGIKTIEVHVNSPGGDVYEAIAIMNTLRQHEARVVTIVDGLAASSAGFIAVGASDELIMAPNSELMAHLPWSYARGNAADLRKTADDLDRIATNIASIFATRTATPVADWLQVLTDETWWSAAEAVDAGLAHRVLAAEPDGPDAEAAKNRFDLSVFNHAGRRFAPPPARICALSQAPQPAEAEANRGKEPIVATLNEGLAELLGIAADAGDEAILAAAKEAFEGRATDAAAAPDTEPTVDQITAAAEKAGLVLVNKAQWESTVTAAQDGAEARKQQLADADAALVDAAIRDGKFGPADRAYYLAMLNSNRELTTGFINKMAKGFIPTQEVGHSTQAVDGIPDDLGWFDSAPTAPSIAGQE